MRPCLDHAPGFESAQVNSKRRVSNSAADNRAWYHVCMVFQVRGKGDLRITEVGVVGSVDPEVFARVIAETDHGADIEARLTQAASDAAAAATTAPSQTQADALAAADAPSALNPYVTGTNWSFLRRGIYVTPEDFGAIGDDKADDLHALQAATSAAIIARRPLVLRGGATYRINAPWIVGGGNGGFASVKILSTFTGCNPIFGGAIIHTTTPNLPGMIVQGCFDSYFADFWVLGDNIINPEMFASRNPADYVARGFSTSRFHPQCSISIDPFTGSVPPDGGYPGQSYGKLASNSCTFERVQALRSIAGVWIYGGNGGEEVLASSMVFKSCSAGGGITGFSSTSSQARNNSLVDCKFGNTHIGVDNLYWGGQRGAAWRVIGSEISECFMLFNINTENDVFRADKVTCESSNCLGVFQGGKPALFTGCDFDLSDSGSQPSIVHGLQNSPMRFTSCSFNLGGPALNMISSYRGAPIVFESCGFGGNVNGQLPPVPATEQPSFVCHRLAGGYATGSISIVRDSMFGGRLAVGTAGYNADADIPTGNTALPVSVHTRRVRTLGVESGYLGDGDMTLKPSFHERALLVLCTAPIVTWAHDFSSVQITGVNTLEVVVGDLLFWPAALFEDGGSPCLQRAAVQGSANNIYRLGIPALRVSAVNVNVSTHDTVTAFPIGDVMDLSHNYTPDYLRVRFEDWTPIALLTGTWTTNSKTILISDSTALLYNGYVVKAAAGLPTNCRVTAQLGASVTLSKFPTASKTAEPIYCSQLKPL